MSKDIEENLIIPKSVAIILDGNGRWAKNNNKPRSFGHKRGVLVVEDICREASKIGIEYLTLYAFSTENWSRPKIEINALMKLLHSYINKCINEYIDNNMVIRFVGRRDRLDDSLVDLIKNLEDKTKTCTGLNLTIALDYGARDEIIRAVNKVHNNYNNSQIITEDIFNKYLDTYDLPDPDLLIRTSGEKRLSNFLLWQMAYTEFYFTDVCWPDFTKKELMNAILDYNNRNRKFGSI